MSPTSLYEYLIERLERLPAAARLILVLDPGGKLSLMDEIVNDQGSAWKVLRYDGNDLALRCQFDPAKATLVWVTGPKALTEPIRIDLTSLVDIVRRTDEILDASLIGCLQTLLPNETWPEGPIADYAAIIGPRLDDFIRTYQDLKPHLGPGAALGTHTIQALVLACLQPSIQPIDFLFRVDSPVALLKKYITFAWTLEWDATGLNLLQKQAREASLLSLGSLAEWFEADLHSLAQLIYFYRSMSSARIPNIINQIRGLGLLAFDPDPLEAGLGQVMGLWEKDTSWRNRLIQNAEANLDLETIHRATGLLSPTSIEFTKNLADGEAPALVYSLAGRLVEKDTKEGKLKELLETWKEYRPSVLDRIDENTTVYSQYLLALGNALDDATFIQEHLLQAIAGVSTLDNLVKWYVQGRYYDLEYAHARAIMACAKLKEESLRSHVQTILNELREGLRDYLDQADHILAKQIQQNWYTYSTSPELASNVLRDFVERARLAPTDTACLWLIVFDGMRFDTWKKVVKPRLQRVFEIKKEKTYLAALPSWTSIARTSIISGRTPDLWKGYHNNFTYNQALLAGKFFNLPENQYLQKLRFYSGMESDRTHSQFDRNKRYPYNILIFNISDDDLHKQRDHIGALNENIKSAVDRILFFLDGLILKDDTVIVTSDHGFMELDPGYAIEVKEINKWQRYLDGGEHPVHFRFIRSDDPGENLPQEHIAGFEWKMPDGKFTVAVGRRWFQREASTYSVRYDHGGISFAEMVVPGVVMQPIREKNIDLRFDGLPTEIRVDEGQQLSLDIYIANRGNQPGSFELQYKLDTDRSPWKIDGQVLPNSRYEVALKLNPIILVGRKKTSKLTLILNFVSVKAQIQTRRQDIPVNVIERKDVVEISLGGLDDLDL